MAIPDSWLVRHYRGVTNPGNTLLTDETGGHNATVYGNPDSSHTDRGAAFDFDGVDDYLAGFGSGVFMDALSLWIYFPNDITASTTTVPIGAVYPQSGGMGGGVLSSNISGETLWIGNYPSSSLFRFRWCSGVVGSGWRNIVFNWNGADYDICVDGITRATSTYMNGSQATLEGRQLIDDLQIGKSAFAGGLSSLSVANIKIFSNGGLGLTPEHLLDVYNDAVSHEITGEVSKDGQPVIADIRIYNASSGAHLTTVASDSSGHYSAPLGNNEPVYLMATPPIGYSPEIRGAITPEIPPAGAPVDIAFVPLAEPLEYHAWVRGTVTKYNEPVALKVTAFAVLGSPKIVGEATTDPLTGMYEIDVAPHTGEVMVVAAMDYGAQWSPNMLIQHAGKVIHPTAHNRHIYVSLVPGVCGSVEPNWPTSGNITSGGVIFTAQPLFEPLAGGYLKPTIEPK